MAEVLLFHHVQGLTPGIVHFANVLREAGHTVHTPDLFDGQAFDTINEGLAFIDELDFSIVLERGREEAERLNPELVYAGFSLGVIPAQQLAQTRKGARGALFFSACVPPAEFGSEWPTQVPLQIHGMDEDPFFAGEGDLAAARDLVRATPSAELFVYSGSAHLFADSSLPSYDAKVSALMTQRVLRFLDSVD